MDSKWNNCIVSIFNLLSAVTLVRNQCGVCDFNTERPSLALYLFLVTNLPLGFIPLQISTKWCTSLLLCNPLKFSFQCYNFMNLSPFIINPMELFPSFSFLSSISNTSFKLPLFLISGILLSPLLPFSCLFLSGALAPFLSFGLFSLFVHKSGYFLGFFDFTPCFFSLYIFFLACVFFFFF